MNIIGLCFNHSFLSLSEISHWIPSHTSSLALVGSTEAEFADLHVCIILFIIAPETGSITLIITFGVGIDELPHFQYVVHIKVMSNYFIV
jgi:hypothetical protein